MKAREAGLSFGTDVRCFSENNAGFVAYHHAQRSHSETHNGASMAKGDQRNEKMTKKPKKDTSPPKPPSVSDRPKPPMTVVAPRGKIKDK